METLLGASGEMRENYSKEANVGKNEQEEGEADKPIDALIVFGASILSDEQLQKMDRLKQELMQERPGYARMRLPLAAKLRVIATAELFLHGQVRDIILTGGRVQEKKGVSESEAELMRDYLEKILNKRWRREIIDRAKSNGESVDEDSLSQRTEARWQEVLPHILLEDKALSTMQNFSNSVNFLDQHKGDYANIAFLSNGFHLPRIQDIADKYRVSGASQGAEELAEQRSKHHRSLTQKYFDLEGNLAFRQSVFDATTSDHEQEVLSARVGGSMDEAMKIETYNRRALERVPEFWLPDVIFVEDVDRLKKIIKDNEVEEIVESAGVEDIDVATKEQILDSLSKIKKKSPPREWREEDYDYKSDAV